MRWMTKFRSSAAFLSLLLTACATSSGAPVARIAEPGIAASYLPLRARIHLGLTSADGAAVVIAPGIAATNAHNADLVDPKQVIGQVSDYDLLYFRTPGKSVAAQSEPVVGTMVTAYGQGVDGELRIAHGVVRAIATCPGCLAPAYFTFAGNAGPGCSGGGEGGGGSFGGGGGRERVGAGEAPASFQRDEMDDEIPF